MIPYGRQTIDETDIQVVVEVLRSDWLTTGPKVAEFEDALARFTGAGYAVAVSNGTAALHAAMFALGIGPGDEVIVPAITFVASANCVAFQGGIPVFADVDPETLLIDPEKVEPHISSRTRAIIAVDYAGQPCDYDGLRRIAGKHGLHLIADACHALGAHDRGRPVGSLAQLNAFSFHPVKHITTGEGGAVTTGDPRLAERMRTFRNHGIMTDHRQREKQGSWFYEMVELGYNYRLSDIQCALGISQLKRLPQWVARRQAIARTYDRAFSEIPGLAPLQVRPEVSHAYHLYVVRLNEKRIGRSREIVFQELRSRGIGVNVHYIPVYWHPFYQKHFKTQVGMCPCAEAAYEQILSLPIYPGLDDDGVESVIQAVQDVCRSGEE